MLNVHEARFECQPLCPSIIKYDFGSKVFWWLVVSIQIQWQHQNPMIPINSSILSSLLFSFQAATKYSINTWRFKSPNQWKKPPSVYIILQWNYANQIYLLNTIDMKCVIRYALICHTNFVLVQIFSIAYHTIFEINCMENSDSNQKCYNLFEYFESKNRIELKKWVYVDCRKIFHLNPPELANQFQSTFEIESNSILLEHQKSHNTSMHVHLKTLAELILLLLANT